MFENARRGRQARHFTTNVSKILDLKSSSEQTFSENWRWVPLTLPSGLKRYQESFFDMLLERLTTVEVNPQVLIRGCSLTVPFPSLEHSMKMEVYEKLKIA